MRTGYLKACEMIVVGHEGEYQITEDSDRRIFTCCTCYDHCICGYGTCEKCGGTLCYNCTMDGIEHEESESEPEVAESVTPEEVMRTDSDNLDPDLIPFSLEGQQLITHFFNQ